MIIIKKYKDTHSALVYCTELKCKENMGTFKYRLETKHEDLHGFKNNVFVVLSFVS